MSLSSITKPTTNRNQPNYSRRCAREMFLGMKANAAQAYTEKTRQECLAFPSTVFGMFDVRLVGFIVHFYAKFLDHRGNRNHAYCVGGN